MPFKSLIALISFLMIFSASLATAQAVGEGARVAVPDVPGGALVSGCYKADRNLYGPYRLTFCLQRKGIYAVRGDGLRCDGTLTWKTKGRDVNITFRRQSCNRGLVWAEANIVCRPRDALDLLLDELLDRLQRSGDKRLVVPANPFVAKLRCDYRSPIVGIRPTTFLAIRQ
jgi:hypothetical protein